MDYEDSPEQAALREVVRDFCGRHASSPGVLADGVTAAGVWQRLTGELGLAGLAIAERHGGTGAGLAEVAVAAQELGRVLLPVPYLSTAVAGAVLSEGDPELLSPLLPALASGKLTAAFAVDADVVAADADEADGPDASMTRRLSGTARHVLDGADASVFLVPAPDGLLYAARARDTAVAAAGTLDQTRSQAMVTFRDSPALATGLDAGRAVSLLRAVLAAESAATAARCLEVTVAYLKTRRQFGRAIGSFQALKHRCADLAVEVTAAQATARAAVAACMASAGAAPAGPVAAGPAQAAVTAALAKLYCADVSWHAAAEMVQLHGGIGITWEHPAHRYLKRAKTTQLVLGTPGELRRLIASLAGLAG